MRTSRTAAVALTAGLLLAGCGGTAETAGGGRTTTPDAVLAGPGPAPEAVVDAPADEVWGLAQLVPPADVAVTSSVRRPDLQGLASYLLVGTTTPEGASSLCDQLGGLVPVDASGLTGPELAGWGLSAPPAGELGRCGGPEPVVPSIRRDVLVATDTDTDTGTGTGTAVSTLWVSAYDTPPTP